MTSKEGFLTNIKTAEVFYRYCHRYRVTGEADRLAVIRRLVAKKKARYIREPDEFLRGKTVAVIK